LTHNLSHDYHPHAANSSCDAPDGAGMSTQVLVPGELLAAMAGGDHRALEALYRAWSRQVRVFAHARLLRCGLDADAIAGEVTVDVFHELWRDPLRYDGRVAFATW